ncbi:hypothetical protein DFP72DRAFT_1152253 [Ephemerocybe angulata]|uniref:DUF6533 domain-containing protein n=1 Tax=Ephemerocybe angulata TaxID=980116 RepID=A0A8H6LXM7_9AGAR|nr:hypothetical protein DFP72DRAFT_1152253 [Tulosesus angulatus]
MSLIPEDISGVISIFSQSQVVEYIYLPARFAHDTSQVGFQTFFVYYYLTTVATEVNLMWPRRWRWGKALFLINRYFPMMDYVATILSGFRVYIDLSPKLTSFASGLYGHLSNLADSDTSTVPSRASWGSALISHPYFGNISGNIIYAAGLSLGGNLIQIGLFEEMSHGISTASANKGVIAGYISLTKALCIFALALLIFLVGSNSMGPPAVIVTRSAVSNSTYFGSGWFLSTRYYIAKTLSISVVPILANRLLLNMWRTQDPEVRKTVSSILFDPPRPGEDSGDDDEEFANRPIEMARYEGLGRRRAPARDETEGTPQGGAGATQAGENGEGV